MPSPSARPEPAGERPSGPGANRDRLLDGYARWVPGARAGDHQAVDGLLRELRPAVLRYCLARLGWQRAEDVTQDVCMSVVASLGRYEDRGLPFGAFAFRIAQRRVADAHRAAARDRVDAVAELPEVVDLNTPGPPEIAEHNELAARARDLLETLPAQQREVLLLRVVGGLSAQETADTLGLSAGNVRVVQHRALNRLRALAAGDADSDEP